MSNQGCSRTVLFAINQSALPAKTPKVDEEELGECDITLVPPTTMCHSQTRGVGGAGDETGGWYELSESFSRICE